MSYSKSQQEFIDIIEQGKNVFLTGKAGTGKSFIVKEAIALLKKKGRRVIAVAPTGVAANNLGGATIHSTFNLGVHGVADFDNCRWMKSEKRRMIDMVDTIFIDEVSMLRPDTLDSIEWILRKNGCDSLSTKQIILIGDMMQLPPAIDENTKAVLLRTYPNETWECAKIVSKLDLVNLELSEVLRQSDYEFIENLNIIRIGGKSQYFRQFITTETKGVILAPHNETVKKYNQVGFDQTQGTPYLFKADVDGTTKAEDFNLESEINVKVGCKIMYLQNSSGGDLVNGTLGIFNEKDGKFFITVGKVDYELERTTFKKKAYVLDHKTKDLVLMEVGSITQYPFRLAFALSIHKSQGLTFDEVTIDLTRPCFAKGQLYVAMSRVTSPKGLNIII